MNSYVELKILPGAEIEPHAVMESLYGKLHLALVNIETEAIGVSFPGFRKETLGSVLRLHGDRGALEQLMGSNWYRHLSDYIRVSQVLPVPSASEFRVVSRAQAKSGVGRLRRRAMKRHNLSADEARERIPEQAAEYLELPFIRVKSSSTNQEFPLFVSHGPICTKAREGKFTKYGFSTNATIPWF